MSGKPDPKSGKPGRALETELVHGGSVRSQFGETSEAMFLTSGFIYDRSEQAEARFEGEDKGYVYSRYANPTVEMFEKRMCLIEGAEAARATASGMAAVSGALFALLSAGDHLVASRALFGSCRYIVEDLAPRFGIESTLIDGRDLAAWKNAVKPNTRAFFFETPTNPTLDLVDIQAVSDIAHENSAKVVIDNVFATPLFQNPLALGADIVAYSATKHIDGQGRCLGGVVLGKEEFIMEDLFNYLKHTGPALSPFNAWIMLKGLETLKLRVEKSSETAARIADFLGTHSAISRVLYPTRDDHPQVELARTQMSCGSTLVAFELPGSKSDAFAFQNALEIVRISNNLGDAKSLITHPATTTHQRIGADARAELGISDTLLRLSVGLEDVTDLCSDIDQALNKARIT